jgi:hypothetical protein
VPIFFRRIFNETPLGRARKRPSSTAIPYVSILMNLIEDGQEEPVGVILQEDECGLNVN